MFFNKIKGITPKVFLITFLMVMAFFLIVMSIQTFVFAYDLIGREDDKLAGALVKSADNLSSVMEEEDIEEISQYDFIVKSMLEKFRNLSGDSVVYEFLITNAQGEIVCSLNNEIAVIFLHSDLPFYKFATLDILSDEQLYKLANTLNEKVEPLTRLANITALGIVRPESRIGDNAYALDAYKLNINGYDKMPIIGEDYTSGVKDYREDMHLGNIIGKYGGHFIHSKNNTFEYFSMMNANRKMLISAVKENKYDETKSISGAVLYETTMINRDYNLVVRAQFNPLKEIVEANKGTYLILSLIMILLTLILSFAFSRFVVKPVRRIDEKAKKLAKLDFSKDGDSEYSGNDEIGSLYNSVNTLATSLSAAISELKDENRELAKDIEREREFDIKRREFVAATSHELKTPLARIRGYAEALDLNLSEEKKDFYCKSLMNEIDIMNEMILEMLALSKLEAENYNSLDICKIDLLKITNDIVERSKKLLADKEIILETFAKSEVMECKGDYPKIERVVTNFIDNAIHYTPEGRKIQIRMTCNDCKMRFEIENEGSHVDDDILPYIWDSFYKGEKARTKSKKTVTAERTGLGLSIVKVILNLHCAEFGVKNTDKGVLFFFELDK